MLLDFEQQDAAFAIFQSPKMRLWNATSSSTLFAVDLIRSVPCMFILFATFVHVYFEHSAGKIPEYSTVELLVDSNVYQQTSVLWSLGHVILRSSGRSHACMFWAFSDVVVFVWYCLFSLICRAKTCISWQECLVFEGQLWRTTIAWIWETTHSIFTYFSCMRYLSLLQTTRCDWFSMGAAVFSSQTHIACVFQIKGFLAILVADFARLQVSVRYTYE